MSKEQIMDRITFTIDPSRMSAADALSLLEEVREELDSMIGALKDDLNK